jgi:hypothetical protein
VLYLECQKNLEKEKDKKNKFLNLILAFENDIKKMESQLNICNDDNIIDKDLSIDGNINTHDSVLDMHENLHENVIEKMIENIHEYKHEKNHENMLGNTDKDKHENNTENTVENELDNELGDLKIVIDSSEIIDVIPRPTTPKENVLLKTSSFKESLKETSLL